MKKINYAIAAFAVILAGCAKVNEIEKTPGNEAVQNDNVVTLHASVPVDEGTKVTADNAGTFLWQASDKITVLNDGGTAYDFTATSAGSSSDFTCASFTGSLSEEAFYPASENHTSGKFYLEPSITWIENASMMPMLGTINTSTKEVSFRATGAVLKLVCYNVDKDADKLLVTSASKKIVGEFTPAVGTKAISASDALSENVLTINFATAGAARTMVFYIPLPIGNVGILTFTFKNGDIKVYEKATTGAVILTRNKMLVAPVINCVDDIELWSESFGSFGSGTTGYGGASITYTTNDTGTKTYNENNAGGTKPELLIKGNKTLVVSGIPTNSSSSMTLKYKTNAKSLTLSSSTNGISISPYSSSTKAEHTAIITNAKNASTFDITFAAGGDNVRIDDITVKMTPSYAGASNITISDASLSIDVSSGDTNSASTTLTYSNPIDAFDVACSVNSEAISWLSAEVTGSGPYTLTVTAPKNPGVEKRDGKVTLRATGVSKTINVTQPGSKVATPTFTVPGGAYGSTQSVELNCATDGATIHYTTDGTTPTGSSPTYSSAISVSSTTTIKAIATKANYTNSEIASATYTISDGGGLLYSTIDFDSTLGTYSYWEFSNLTSQSTTKTGHGGTGKMAVTNGTTTAYAKTKNKVSSPAGLTCYYTKCSSNTNSSSKFIIQVSSDGSTWTDVATGNTMNNVTEGTWYELTGDLSSYSDVYVRVYYTGTTAVRGLDDISLSYND